MSPEQFAYWLQGFVELNGGKLPTAAQWKSIKEHLGEVFTKVTQPVDVPSVRSPLPADDKNKELINELRSHRSVIYPGRIC